MDNRNRKKVIKAVARKFFHDMREFTQKDIVDALEDALESNKSLQKHNEALTKENAKLRKQLGLEEY